MGSHSDRGCISGLLPGKWPLGSWSYVVGFLENLWGWVRGWGKMSGEDCQETLAAAEIGASMNLSAASVRGDGAKFWGVIQNTQKAISVDNLRHSKARELRWARQKGDIWRSKRIPNFVLETWTHKRIQLGTSEEIYLKRMRKWDGVPIAVEVAVYEEKGAG